MRSFRFEVSDFLRGALLVPGLILVGCSSTSNGGTKSLGGQTARAGEVTAGAPSAGNSAQANKGVRQGVANDVGALASAAAAAGVSGSVGASAGPSAAAVGGTGAPAVAGQGAMAGTSGMPGPTAGSGASAAVLVEPAPADVSRWEKPGAYNAMTESSAGPGRAYTMFRPSELGKDGFKHPIVTWGNGSGTTPMQYSALLSHWASHGFVVVASNATDTGSGKEMIAGVDWLLEESQRADSTYYGKLDASSIGAIGHSQGGIGTVIAAVDPRVTTSVPIAGGDSKIDQVHGPTFLIGMVSDTVVPPLWNMAPQYEAAHGPAIYGVLQGGATHLEAMRDGGRLRGYTTAWLVYQLMKNQSLSGVFYGKDCTLCRDMSWVIERKNVPGADPAPMPSKDECLSKATFPASAAPACKECLCGGCPQEAIQCSDTCWELAQCMVKRCTNNADKDIAHFACTGITADAVCGSSADGIRWTTAMSKHGAGCMAPGKCLEICIP